MMMQGKMKAKCVLTAMAVFVGVQSISAQKVDDVMKLLDYEKYESAVKMMENIAKANPTDAATQFYLGETYSRIGKPDEAKKAFDKAVVNNAKEPLGYIGLGKLLYAKGSVAEAKKSIDQALKLSKSKNVNVLRYAAEAYLTGKKPDPTTAIGLLAKAKALDKKNLNVLMALGDAEAANAKNGNIGPAVTAYEYAVEANKTSALPLYKIGVAYLNAKNPNEAIKFFEKAKKTDPNFAPVYRKMGEYYYQQEKITLAKENYTKFMEIGETKIEDEIEYANILFISKDYSNAVTLLEKIKVKDPNNNYLNRLLGYTYYETGKYEDGLKSLETFMTNADAKKIQSLDYEYQAKIYEKTNQADKALVIYDKLLVTDPKRTDIADTLASRAFAAKKYSEAGKYLEMKANTTGEAGDYYSAGYDYYFGKEYTKADELFTKALEKNPTSVKSLYWRGRCNTKLEPDITTGDAAAKTAFGKAKPYFDKVIELGEPEKDKYVKELAESYNYLSTYYFVKDDMTNAKNYANKTLAIDPANKNAKKMLEGLGGN
jgi:tetratricopeptide (TPR) repeat protein